LTERPKELTKSTHTFDNELLQRCFGADTLVDVKFGQAQKMLFDLESVLKQKVVNCVIFCRTQDASGEQCDATISVGTFSAELISDFANSAAEVFHGMAVALRIKDQILRGNVKP
jgi:hypothetical protein